MTTTRRYLRAKVSATAFRSRRPKLRPRWTRTRSRPGSTPAMCSSLATMTSAPTAWAMCSVCPSKAVAMALALAPVAWTARLGLAFASWRAREDQNGAALGWDRHIRIGRFQIHPSTATRRRAHTASRAVMDVRDRAHGEPAGRNVAESACRRIAISSRTARNRARSAVGFTLPAAGSVSGQCS